MGILFRNWLEEGFYEEDGWGDLTKIDEPRRIREAANSGTLYHHDGMGMSKTDSPEEIHNFQKLVKDEQRNDSSY
jgi:hypothetical protein